MVAYINETYASCKVARRSVSGRVIMFVRGLCLDCLCHKWLSFFVCANRGEFRLLMASRSLVLEANVWLHVAEETSA